MAGHEMIALKYAKILGFLTTPISIMYTIKIKGAVASETQNELIAWANYRAICRQFENKPSPIELHSDDKLLHKKDAGMMLLDNVDNYDANDVLTATMSKLGIGVSELKKMLADTELSASSSRIDGWVRAKDDRRFVQLHHDELMIALDVMLSSITDGIKTPANIVALRQKLGMTQTELAEALGMKATNLQVLRWEKGIAEMPDSKWQKMQKLLK